MIKRYHYLRKVERKVMVKPYQRLGEMYLWGTPKTKTDLKRSKNYFEKAIGCGYENYAYVYLSRVFEQAIVRDNTKLSQNLIEHLDRISLQEKYIPECMKYLEAGVLKNIPSAYTEKGKLLY